MNLDSLSFLLQRVGSPITAPPPPPLPTAASTPSLLADPDASPVTLPELLLTNLWSKTLIPAKPGEYADYPSDLHPNLNFFKSKFPRLYSHQAEAFHPISNHLDTMIVSSTAAGKTLAAYLGVFQQLLENPEMTAIALYSLKALAIDQGNTLREWCDQAGIRFAQLSGDTEFKERAEIMAGKPQLLAITPDLLHYYMLPQTHWNASIGEFVKNIRTVLIDEIHTYHGTMGTNTHWLLRRLVNFQENNNSDYDENQLQFIGLSATCSNPDALFENLTGHSTDHVITKSGAPQHQKELLILKPSEAYNAILKTLIWATQRNYKGIVFCNTKRAAKRLCTSFITQATDLGIPNPQQCVKAFYTGLSTTVRTSMIQNLEDGKINFLAATSALEAGIDLPDLDISILYGFPDKLDAFWQRAGRAARQNSGYIIYAPLPNNSIDAYYSQKRRLFGEHLPVTFQRNNALIVANHLKCAAKESGINRHTSDTTFGPQVSPIIDWLAQQGQLRRRRDGILYCTDRNAHRNLQFRGGTNDRSFKVLLNDDKADPIETLDQSTCYRELYDGAIYQNQTEEGIVTLRSLGPETDPEKEAIVYVTPFNSDGNFTEADVDLDITSNQESIETWQIPLNSGGHLLFETNFGTVSQLVLGYDLCNSKTTYTCNNKRCTNNNVDLRSNNGLKLCQKCSRPLQAQFSKNIIKSYVFDSPLATGHLSPTLTLRLDSEAIQVIKTKLSALHAKSPHSKAIIRILDEYTEGYLALHSLSHQLMAAIPIAIQYSAKQIESFCLVKGGQDTVVFYDTVHYGNGCTEALKEYWNEICTVAFEIATSCDCETGCPKCSTRTSCPEQNAAILKQAGLILLEEILPLKGFDSLEEDDEYLIEDEVN